MKKKRFSSGRIPSGWEIGGTHIECYELGVDEKQVFKGKYAGFIKSIVDKVEGDGKLFQRLPVYSFRDKKLRFAGSVKADSVVGSAGLWMTIDGTVKTGLRFDDMSNRSIEGTQDWTECEIVLDVPYEAEFFSLGAYLKGSGQIWISDLTFEEATQGAATTDQYEKPGVLPINLNFSDLRDGVLRTWYPWGVHADKFEMGIDEQVKYSGERSATIRSKPKAATKSVGACFAQTIRADLFRGKRIQLTGFVKTRSVSCSSCLFVRVDGVSCHGISLDFMENRKLSGSSNWTKCSIVLDVPDKAHTIIIGGQLIGTGQMWFDGLEFSETDKSTPPTNQKTLDMCIPRNLDFTA